MLRTRGKWRVFVHLRNYLKYTVVAVAFIMPQYEDFQNA